MKNFLFAIFRQKLGKLLLTLFIFSLSYFTVFSQELLVNGNMESETGWTVYNLKSSGTVDYEFNYTDEIPDGGSGGCLRITAPAVSFQILIWQKVTLTAGKTYRLDGVVKIDTIDLFWSQIYVSKIAPVAGQEYRPNGGATDMQLGISTWQGCGPNLNGTLSALHCQGNGSMYTAPGTAGEDVEVYVAIKVGSNAADTSIFEVLYDELTFTLLDNSSLYNTEEGILVQDSMKVKDVSPFLTVKNFKNSLKTHFTSSTQIVASSNGNAIAGQDTALISDTMRIRVIGNDSSFYTIELRPEGTANEILSTNIGTLDAGNSKITDLPTNALVVQLKSGLTVSDYASFKIMDTAEVASYAKLDTSLKIQVTSESGEVKEYSLELGVSTIQEETLTDELDTVTSIENKIVTLEGSTNMHFTNSEDPLKGSILKFNSGDIWLYFPNIKPLAFKDKYLDHIIIGDTGAIVNGNMRLVRFLDGCVVISHTSDYKALEIFDGTYLTGNSLELGLYTYNRATQLGSMHDKVRSFRLKKGYMATFAKDEMGTGYSRNYIADKEDVVIDSLPAGLYDAVSFIRVFPWRWVTKKGHAGSDKYTVGNLLNCTWHYNWSAGGNSNLDVEYIPMRHNKWWDGYNKINSKENTTHVLGFNEPTHKDQADMTVDEMIKQWPKLLESGLRLGSPAPADDGIDTLYEFIDRCEELNYRVDFIAMHWYMGNKKPSEFYNRLKSIHNKTGGRPIWITEWNNGAGWTNNQEIPTFESQAREIAGFLHMLDTTSFVERYAIYQWVGETRLAIKNGKLTPAGEVYRDKVSPMAYNPDYVKNWEYGAFASNPYPANNATNVPVDTLLHWTSSDASSSHKIYFGTTDPPPYKKTTSDTVYNPGELSSKKTYYWRIDEVYPFGVRKGSVWKFTTEEVTSTEKVLEKQRVIISPNPLKDQLTVIGLEEEKNIEIFNIVGNKLLTSKMKNTLDVSWLSNGMYILKIDGYKPIRFMKE